MNDKTRLNEADAEALLPWYVNGTLEADQRRQVEAALDRSQSLCHELVRMERLGSLVASEAAPVPEPAPEGFARLRQMMAPSAPRSQSTDWASRLAGFFELTMRPAVVVSLAVVIVVETAAIVTIAPGSAPPRFVTASGPAEGAKAVVQFKPETTLSEIHMILAAEQATIVRGPTPDGSLVVQWPGLGTEAVDRAIERLRTHPEYVLRAERGS